MTANDTTTTNTFAGKTAEQWAKMAKDVRNRGRESFEQSDIGGALSQQAALVMGRHYSWCAEIARDGGTMEEEGLFDLDGNLVPAKDTQTQYGWSWRLLDEDGSTLGWFNPSQARNEETARKNNAKKGYYVGTVRVVAALNNRTGEPYATQEVVEILDNGQ